VLPFEVMDGELARSGISRSFNEILVVELSRLEGVRVVSPSTVERYRWVGIGPQVMARLLGLDVILEGTIQRGDGGLLVTTRLADVTARLIWAETHDQPAADVALARRIAAEVGRKLAESHAKR
jgi:TolB-like protein